jgi:hypothetical protein
MPGQDHPAAWHSIPVAHLRVAVLFVSGLDERLFKTDRVDLSRTRGEMLESERAA